MKWIRKVLGVLILSFDRAFSPKGPVRTASAQAALDRRLENHTLYQLVACPFCVKVRRQLRRQGLNVKMKDIGADPSAHAELMAGGKQDQVPCLRIDGTTGTQWMYESDAINGYLKTTFGD